MDPQAVANYPVKARYRGWLLVGAGWLAGCQSTPLLFRADEALRAGRPAEALASYEAHRRVVGDDPQLRARRQAAVEAWVDQHLARAAERWAAGAKEEARTWVWTALVEARTYQAPRAIRKASAVWTAWRDAEWASAVEAHARAGHFRSAIQAAEWWAAPVLDAEVQGRQADLRQRAQVFHQRRAEMATGPARGFHRALARAFGAKGFKDLTAALQKTMRDARAFEGQLMVTLPPGCTGPTTPRRAGTRVDVTLSTCPDLNAPETRVTGRLSISGPDASVLRPIRRTTPPTWAAIRAALEDETRAAVGDFQARRAQALNRRAIQWAKEGAWIRAEDGFLLATWIRGAPPEAARGYFETQYGLPVWAWQRAMRGEIWPKFPDLTPGRRRLPPPLWSPWEAGWARQAVRRQPSTRGIEGTLGGVVTSTPISGRMHGIRLRAGTDRWRVRLESAGPVFGASARHFGGGGQVRLMDWGSVAFWTGLEGDRIWVDEHEFWSLTAPGIVRVALKDFGQLDAGLALNLFQLARAVSAWTPEAEVYSRVWVGATFYPIREVYFRFEALHDLGRTDGPWVRFGGSLGVRL